VEAVDFEAPEKSKEKYFLIISHLFILSRDLFLKQNLKRYL